MKIVARIEKIGVDQYLYEGKLFSSFLSARREMTERMRARRLERQVRALRMSRTHCVGA